MSELNSCPFCPDGGLPKLTYGFATFSNPNNPDELIHATRYHAFCQNCHASGPERMTPEEATAAWNTRYQPTGEWEAVTNPYGEITEYMCECGRCMGGVPKYCPECGAKVVYQ